MPARALPIRPSRDDDRAALGCKRGLGLDAMPMPHAHDPGAAAPGRS
ncbi:MAG: hypothetical protein J0L57_20125 [Burkholderiales bacterium]|nr:hypothetical protein [Burkholderiales bacterium]